MATKPPPLNPHLTKHDALLLVDVLNTLDFPGGEKVLPWAQRLAQKLAPFANHCRRAGIPVIYANDHYGLWHARPNDILAHATRPSSPGRHVARRLAPKRKDFFLLKPRHSAFFATPLVPLLEDLNIERLLLAGIATNLCLLFTAHDAHMHRYPMIVLSDACAAESDFDHNTALSQLQKFCRASIATTTQLQFPGRRKG